MSSLRDLFGMLSPKQDGEDDGDFVPDDDFVDDDGAPDMGDDDEADWKPIKREAGAGGGGAKKKAPARKRAKKVRKTFSDTARRTFFRRLI